jgi:hypothetical protein
MHLIKTTGHYGLVCEVESGSTPGAANAPCSRPQYSGHFVLLNRYKVDEAGYIALTPSLPLRDLHGSVDILAAELLGLLDEARQRFPGLALAS